MSSNTAPIKIRYEPKVLLRSASFQKLCAIPFNFKIEAIRSYKEDIKTVIKLLKIATRTYVISLYLKVASIILFNYNAIALRYRSKITYLTANATQTQNVHAGIAQNRPISERNLQSRNYKQVTVGGLLDIDIVGIQTVLTYSCIAYVGIQMAWLVNVLFSSANIPLGLVFLMLDLGYMGVIIFKIALKDSNFS
ncbi:uncharacterized protein LOC131294806 [Anopheles ziemanni]|uniref:uncharacterized protein LOC131265981 n=1 Tax=Anopheles coustani TaxID=139045 RepID=UPI0026588CC8|nr:uncharacterized protein LOC131265981 [Anopheles coustani]XP_058178834.1 uncharacterized protein LOC131294806 [Anopheles ziemanni]